MKKDNLNYIKPFILSFTIFVSSIVTSAWVSPVSNPQSTSSDVPIHTGAFQIKKQGFLMNGNIGSTGSDSLNYFQNFVLSGTSATTSNSDVKVRSIGGVAAQDYCDGYGNCFANATRGNISGSTGGESFNIWNSSNSLGALSTTSAMAIHINGTRIIFGGRQALISWVGDPKEAQAGIIVAEKFCNLAGQNCFDSSANIPQTIFPPNAVIAFPTATCPTGWTAAGGQTGTLNGYPIPATKSRAIFGQDTSVPAFDTIREFGGAYSRSLVDAHLPAYTLSYGNVYSDSGSAPNRFASLRSSSYGALAKTNFGGSATAIPTEDPYMVHQYCIKNR